MKLVSHLNYNAKNSVLAFLLRAGIFYFIWLFLYELVIKPYTSLDRYVIDNLIDIASVVLKTLNYNLIPVQGADEPIRTIGIDGTHGLWVGDPCNGLTLFAVFLSFLLAFPGKLNIKLWFIPAGLIIIHLINVMRIAALAIIVKIDYNYLDFNHNYTFTILVYSCIFLLWLWFINLNNKSSKNSNLHESL